MSGDQAIHLVEAFSQLLGVVVWPLLVLFVLVRFRVPFTEFLSNLGELNFKAGGVEATAKRRQVEAAAALGAATAVRTSGDDGAVSETSPREIAEALPSLRSQRRLQGKRILWVDDRPRNNEFEAQALEVLGVHIDNSISTEQALKRLHRGSYDLIISDMGRPPDMQAGYTLLDKLREEGDKTPFVIYAGSRAPEHVREAKRHGALGSTNSPQDLFSIVTDALLSSR